MIIRKYVYALFKTAQPDQYERIAKDCLKLHDMLQEHHKLLGDYIPWNEYQIMLDFLQEQLELHDEVMALMRVLKLNKHMNYWQTALLSVYNHWFKLYGSVHILCITAVKYSPEQQELILNGLKDLHDFKQIDVDFIVKPKIMGGYQLIINGYLYDYSLKNIMRQVTQDIQTKLSV